MTSTASPPPRRSPGQLRARRQLLATWITIGVVVAICAAAGVGAYAMTHSWWVAEAPVPSADQQLADGQSRFDRAGVDFLTRQRVATVDVVDPAAANELGLPADASVPVETLVPVTLRVRGSAGVIDFTGVDRFVVTTAGGRLTDVAVHPASSSTWSAMRTDIAQRAQQWGWSADEVAMLEQQVADAGRAQGQAQVVSLPPVPVDGMAVSAHVRVDESGRLALMYVFAR